MVADLTGKNPNVYYELCFAQSFGIPVIMLVNNTSSLPFDVKDERTIQIDDEEGVIDMLKGEYAKDELRKAFKLVLEADFEPRSIITEVAGVQSIESMTPDNPIAAELAAMNRRIDQLQENVSSTMRRGQSQYRVTDLEQLMNYIRVLAGQNLAVVDREGLDNLITDITSPAFDQWVKETIEEYFPRKDINESDFEDIPF